MIQVSNKCTIHRKKSFMADSSCSRTGVWASTTEDGEDAQSVKANSESDDSMKTGTSIKRGKSRPESGRGPARAKKKLDRARDHKEKTKKGMDRRPRGMEGTKSTIEVARSEGQRGCRYVRQADGGEEK